MHRQTHRPIGREEVDGAVRETAEPMTNLPGKTVISQHLQVPIRHLQQTWHL